jgi:hypothetical protein
MTCVRVASTRRQSQFYRELPQIYDIAFFEDHIMQIRQFTGKSVQVLAERIKTVQALLPLKKNLIFTLMHCINVNTV